MRLKFLNINCLIFILLPLSVFSQSPLTSGSFNYILTDRYEILGDSINDNIFSSVKPYRRDFVAKFASNIKPISAVDRFNKDYLLNDNYLYSQFRDDSLIIKDSRQIFKTKNSFVLINENDFKMTLNPVLGFAGASDSEDSIPIYRNSRGIELRGSIGNKVGFYTYLLENQAQNPYFMRSKIKETGFNNGSTLNKSINPDGKDFFNAIGYVTFSPIKEINVQLGQDKNFIGNGYRSLILSDFSASYPFLKVNTKVWKFNYQNLFSQHIDYDPIFSNKKKYSAFHHLSVNLGKNLNIGLFENIIFDRNDSTERGNFELSYFNPIIFYRAVEHSVSGPAGDNAILGMDWKWNFKKRFSFYGQFLFDEFIKDELVSRSKSWVNKWAYQTGLKYINALNVSNLDMQVELNQVRPYFYQHRSVSQNWVHYGQSLAHPLGSNVREIITILRYQPLNKLNINATYSYSIQGLDSSISGTNFGGNYLRDYNNRQTRSYHMPVPMFSGIKNIISAFSLDAHYMIYHNLFVDAGLFIRKENNPTINERLNMIFRFGLRMNLNQIDYRI